MYGIYAMAASGRMQYDYKQTNSQKKVGTGIYRAPSWLPPALSLAMSRRAVLDIHTFLHPPSGLVPKKDAEYTVATGSMKRAEFQSPPKNVVS